MIRFSPPPRTLHRRTFLKGLAFAPAGLALTRLPAWAAEPAAPQPASHGPIGRTLRVADEVKEFKDSETGARVMLLTGGGSDNVHLYFTTDSFVEGSDRASGRLDDARIIVRPQPSAIRGQALRNTPLFEWQRAGEPIPPMADAASAITERNHRAPVIRIVG